MAINRNVLAEKQATVLSEDGNTMYATIQMRHGKESEMDKSKFVPAEMGVATDTKKAFMAFGSNQVKEMMFREDSEIEELLGEVREISDQAVEAVESAEATAKQTIQDFTDQMKATIPEDYNETVKKVDILERTKAPAIYKTASGESLQIEDSADAPVAGLKVFGRSEQVKTTGAQLIPCPIDEELESYDKYVTAIPKDNGIEVTLKTGFNPINSDSNIYFAGGRQANEESNYELQPQIPAGQYHLHIDDETFNRFSFYIVVWRNEASNVLSSGTTQDIDITIQENDKFRIFIRPKTGAATGTYTINPMLNSGSSALPWEPYTGGKPSPSPDYPQEIEIPGSEGSVGVNVTGNNLLDLSKNQDINGSKYTINYDKGMLTANGNSDSTYDIYIKGNWGSDQELFPFGTYTFSVQGGTSDEYIYLIKGAQILSGNSANKSISCTNAITAVLIRLAAGKTYTNFKMYPMLNKGSVALQFEPYKCTSVSISTPNGLPGIPVDSGGNYTDADGQQWICDEVDFDRGKYVQRVKKVVYDGSEDEAWNNSAVTKNRYYTRLKDAKVSTNLICDQCIGKTQYSETVGESGIDSNKNFYINTNYESLEVFNEHISKHPMTVIYVLATPIETDLSEEELTAYAALRTNYPTTVVTSDSDPEVGIEVEYVADTQKYIDNKFAELAQNLAATQNTLLEV